jgi:gliding motility-associated-like protein
MQAGSTTSCPIVTGPISAPGEFCPAITVTSGRTYLIIIDNYSDNGTGFNFTWGGTFTIAPESQFTATPTTSCSPPQSVSFTNNSVAAASQVWNFGNGNTSTASAPPAQTYTATGTYIVSLTTTSATGCQDVFTQNIIIGAPPTVSVPANPTVCGGQSIPASLFSSTPAGATFSWTNDNTATGIPASGSANIPAITAVNFGTTPINSVITVTPTLNGCVGIPSSFTVTVDPGVASEFTQITPICSGGNIALPLTSNNGITGTWSPAVNNVATTTYTFTPAAGQCANAATMEIIVTNGIPATFSPLSSICSGGNLVLPAASSEGFTGSWSPAISNTTSQTYTFTPDAGQCALAGTLTSTVNPIPVLSAINNQTICAGQSISSINYTSTTPGTTINWTNNESTIGLTSSGTGNIASFTGINTGNNSIIATIVATPTANGCEGLPQTFSITVNPIPVLSAVGSQSVCAGQMVNGINFNSSVANSTINWTNSQSGIGVATTGNGNISSFTGTNGGTTSLTGNFTATPTVNGCTGLPQTFSVTVNPNPNAISNNNPQEICGQANATLNILNASGGTTPYLYSLNNGAPSSSVTYSNLTSGTYTLTAIDNNGCSFTKIITITNVPGPTADFVASQQTGFDSLNVAFTNQSSSGSNVTYYWNFGNGNLDTTSNLNFSPNQTFYGTNSYTVSLIASNGISLCNDTATLFIFVDISPYIEVPNVFSPNGDGVNDNFYLNYRGYKELNLIIYNRWGNKMYETTNPAVGWNGADTSEGTYFYIVTGKGSDNKDFEKSGYLTLIR